MNLRSDQPCMTPPFWPKGTVYGTALNFAAELAQLGSQVDEAPYKAAPQAPVLYVKTANTWAPSGAEIAVPARLQAVEIGASVALVVGPFAWDATTGRARPTVAGFVIVSDLSIPHTSLFRPPVKFKCLDGFLGIAGHLVGAEEAGDPARFVLEASVDGTVRQTVRFDRLRRDADTLLSDVAACMALREGDLLLLGCDVGRPQAGAGQRVEIRMVGRPEFGVLTQTLTASAPIAAAPQAPSAADQAPADTRQRPPQRPPVRRARVAWAGAVHDVVEHQGRLRLADGRLISPDEVIWLPPLAPTVRPRSILALGLNYADHARELAFKAPDEPLVFVKGEAGLVGHRAQTLRPRDVKYMHYECELAVVIGRRARNVRREDAYDHVAGYTVANDYAIRDYLENWYRPNLRVKNRATCTPLGPWLVDAADIPDPMALGLRTTVNGRETQSGNTRDMIFDIPYLMEWFSGFMTLEPGDLILTGTPDGVVDCQVGDVVVTEIEGIGALSNTIAEG
jgi:5-oxopent-3-ene-1,2,5-tricarboxylate decarboxylase / 2-hydroxyhepta-2,4-diene-1,7-dioate isomerase